MKRIILILTLIVGFTAAYAEKQTVRLYVPEMECKNCQGKVDKVLAFEKGVRSLEYDLEHRTVTVVFEDKKTDVAKLQEALVKQLKYKSIELKEGEQHKGEKPSCSKACTGHNHEGHENHTHETHNH